MPGQRCKGTGVDCINFVMGCLDELTGNTEPSFLPRYQQDSALHGKNKQSAAHVMEAFKNAHPSRYVIEGDVLEPGDVIICRIGHGSVGGHAAIMGEGMTVYHASAQSHRVVRSSLQVLLGIDYGWHMENKAQRWLKGES